MTPLEQSDEMYESDLMDADISSSEDEEEINELHGQNCRWIHSEKIVDDYCKMFNHYYLTDKTANITNSLRVDDVVLINDDVMEWMRGTVEDLVSGRDGFMRGANVMIVSIEEDVPQETGEFIDNPHETGECKNELQETGECKDELQETEECKDIFHGTGEIIDNLQETGECKDEPQEIGEYKDEVKEKGECEDMPQETRESKYELQETGECKDMLQETGACKYELQIQDSVKTNLKNFVLEHE